MAQRVYLETTIPSYLTAWPSREMVRAAHQLITRQWWETRRTSFELVVSQLVLDECAAGDQTAAQDRLRELEGIPILGVTDAVTGLAVSLVQALTLPAKAVNDALHIAITAVHQVEYLMTWNCTHIANGAFRERIGATCRRAGHQPPQIVTPEELLHGVSDVG
jgi:hypothetical protein